MPSQRQLRVGEQIRHIVAQTLQRGDFYDEALRHASSLTVTEVRPSPDLKNATAYIVSSSGDVADIISALNDHAPEFQKEINRQSNLKFTPRIRFKYDQSFENASRIDDVLRDLNLPRDEDA